MRRGLHRVHDIMERRRPVVAGPEETAQAAAARMTEDGRVLGVVSLRDLPIETVAEVLPELERRRVLAERMW
jgi:CBS domain-containing protein